MALPWYRSDKRVQAMLISQISYEAGDVGATFYGRADDTEHEIQVSSDYMNTHRPTVGGYYVLYENGYESFFPDKQFNEVFKKEDQLEHTLQ